VRIWEKSTGQQRVTLTGSTGELCAFAAAPDSAWLAAAADDGTMRIWNTATGRTGAVMRMDDPLRDCAWSPSGQSLAAAGTGGLYCYTFKP
jgi:WD40 repeat protein